MLPVKKTQPETSKTTTTAKSKNITISFGRRGGQSQPTNPPATHQTTVKNKKKYRKIVKIVKKD